MRTLLLTFSVCLLLTACVFSPAKKPEPVPQAPQAAPDTAQRQSHDDVARQIAGFKGKAGVYAKNLKTAQEFRHNADEIFATASTHKLVVALAVYKYLYAEAPAPQKQRYDRLIMKMMEVSDNPAFYALLDDIERQKPAALTQVLADLNLKQTRIHSREAFLRHRYHSVTTPREMAVVFETIYNSRYLPESASAILKEELAKTIFREEIPRYMKGSKVMHKVGQLPDGTLNDVGIVDDGKDQILISVFTKSGEAPSYSSRFIAGLSAAVYETLRTK